MMRSKAEVQAECIRYLREDREGTWTPACDVVAHLRNWASAGDLRAKAILGDIWHLIGEDRPVERRHIPLMRHPVTGRMYYSELRVKP